jgi:uncharacterized protein YjbJ (UPF0337 family)
MIALGAQPHQADRSLELAGRKLVLRASPKEAIHMNEDRVEGTVKEFAGKAQSAAGDLLGDRKTQAEGRLREATGTAQEYYGAAADQIRGLSEELTDRIHETPLLAVLGAVGLGYLIGRLSAR